jgi:pimeloyl-ACP methyl ester carboxylesterase
MKSTIITTFAALAIAAAMTDVSFAAPQTSDLSKVRGSDELVTYHTVDVDGIKVFYREAGRHSLPILVLMHGATESSFMFRDLIPRLATKFHVLAPDYPGCGYSEAPVPNVFVYSFDHLAQIMDHFLNQQQAGRYILYLHDYGGPIGFRIATAHPERVAGLIIQSANAYSEGLSSEWRAKLEDDLKNGGPPKAVPGAQVPATPLSLAKAMEQLKHMYEAGAQDPARVSPDGYTFDAAMLSRPGQDPIQDALDGDYYTNLALYPTWQQWLRTHQPRTLIVWGEADTIFNADGARAFRRDVPNAKLVLYHGGHFLLEEYAPDVAKEIIQMYIGGIGKASPST